MLGTAFATRGGVSAVVAIYRQAGLFDRWPVIYLDTHCDGSRLAKFVVALGALVRFLALVAAGRVAAVHVHGASGASFWRKSVFLLAAYACRRPVLFHLHGGGFWAFSQRIGPLGRCFVRALLDRAAVVVVLSNQWRETIARLSDNRRVRVIVNPVQLPPPRGREPEAATLLFLGRLTEAKGLRELLQAIARLRGDFPQLRLVCAGEGDFDLAGEARKAGIADLVEQPGWVSGARKADCLARASIFVLPSYFEGMPMGVLEAMAAGQVVVATAVGGVPDVVADGVNGLLVAPRDTTALTDALRRVLCDDELRRRLGAAARATVAERFSADAVVGEVEALYAEMGLNRQDGSRVLPPRAGALTRD